MKIDAQLAERICRLARLSLPEGEKQAVTAQLEQILAYMDLLDRLDTTGVQPADPAPGENVLRPDRAEPSLDRAALLANAPAQDGEMFLTPRSVE